MDTVGQIPVTSGDVADHEYGLDTMAWAKPLYTRQEVNGAGKCLAPAGFADIPSEEELYEALVIINNWRAAHSYPLNTFQITLRNKAKKIDKRCIIAQRTKRLYSIGLKLDRFATMRLSQMQDIGGCRAVVNTVGNVRDLVRLYDESRFKHELAARDDYVAKPRDSGYRGIHLIYRYFSDRKVTSVYNDLKIEIQFRSRSQHAWATAVETVGTFVGQALKSSMGEEGWLRFFALMGTAIALREKCPPVPGTPTDHKELIDELRDYAGKLDVKTRLQAYNDALRALEIPGTKDARFFLLELDSEAREIIVSGFKMSELHEASQRYEEAEKVVRSKPGADAVLVSVESLAALRRAFPNYFADTRVFVRLMEQALLGVRGLRARVTRRATRTARRASTHRR